MDHDGRNSSISSSHSPHRNHNSNENQNKQQQQAQNNKSHHHSLDRESNNKMCRDIGTRQFYNTNPKPHGHSNKQKTPKLPQDGNNQLSRQSMPMNTNKSQTNLISNTIISKSDANMTINSSDECLNIDRMSIHSQCNNDIYKNRHMILTSNKLSKQQYCKYHNFN